MGLGDLPHSQGYAWFFYGYEATISALAGPGKSKADLNYWQVMTAGVMAGFGLWGSMFPIDTLKSKIQGDSLSNPQYKSTLDCYKQVRCRMSCVTGSQGWV